jgi:hypothetical protein
MRKGFALGVFTAVFACVYLACFLNGWTLFRYYPLTGELTTQDLPRAAGPAMGWYAWITQGFLAAAVAGLMVALLPEKWTGRIWSGAGGFAALSVVAFTFFVEWHWFQS